jgi:hypothetical protein
VCNSTVTVHIKTTEIQYINFEEEEMLMDLKEDGQISSETKKKKP